jgi:hypothetical protein
MAPGLDPNAAGAEQGREGNATVAQAICAFWKECVLMMVRVPLFFYFWPKAVVEVYRERVDNASPLGKAGKAIVAAILWPIIVPTIAVVVLVPTAILTLCIPVCLPIAIWQNMRGPRNTPDADTTPLVAEGAGQPVVDEPQRQSERVEVRTTESDPQPDVLSDIKTTGVSNKTEFVQRD